VVDIQKNGVPTTWNPAPPSVTAHHLASYRRRHVLSCAHRPRCRERIEALGVALGSSAHVGIVTTPVGHGSSGRKATQVLRVTARHLDDLGTDFDRFTAPLLPTSPTRFTNCERNLVRRPTRITRATENVARHQKQRRIVIERSTCVPANLPHRVPKRRERLRRDFESEDVGSGSEMVS
jgi:hypothetical protein